MEGGSGNDNRRNEKDAQRGLYRKLGDINRAGYLRMCESKEEEKYEYV